MARRDDETTVVDRRPDVTPEVLVELLEADVAWTHGGRAAMFARVVGGEAGRCASVLAEHLDATRCDWSIDRDGNVSVYPAGRPDEMDTHAPGYVR